MNPPANLPPWWHVMLPHSDIRTARQLNEAIFAADLGQVVRGTAPPDYLDPVRFYTGTFLSVGLCDLLSDVLRTLADKPTGNPIIQIETPFGGGKTHTLIALYHLCQHAAQLTPRPEIQKLLHQAELTSIPATRVAVSFGTDQSALEPVRYPDGTQAYTLWGQLAWQLGGAAAYAQVQASDTQRVAPGADSVRAILADGPAKLILIDELVNYIVAAAGVTIGGTTLRDQTIAFLQQLTQAIAQTPRCVLLLTIPSSQTALYGEAARDLQQEIFRASHQISSITGRVQTVRTPVQGDDIYEVLRRRLFEPPADAAEKDRRREQARQVARAYVALYRTIPGDMPQDVQDEAYIERMVRAYPFHPDVIRLLYERWGTLPDFQRTRGVLRILGLVLAERFTSNQHDPLILPAHFNLAAGPIRNELLRIVQEPAYASVLDSDVAGPDSKAAAIDASTGRELARFQPAVRIATSIFLWSFTGSTSETRGASEAQLRVAVLTPTMPPALIGTTLSELQRRLWYLHTEANTYRFENRANLNRVLVQKEESVTAEQARSHVTEAIAGRARRPAPSGSRVYLFPRASEDVPDHALLGIVLLHPAHAAPAGDQLTHLPDLVRAILLKYGERPRQYRNALLVLVPDSDLVAAADRAARRLIALRHATADASLTLPDAQRQELRQMLAAAEQSFPQEVARIYRSVVVPAAQAVGDMQRIDLGARATAHGETFWDDALEALSHREQYLRKLDPTLLTDPHFGIWPTDAPFVSTQQLWERLIQFPHVPLLAGREVLLHSIAAGCDQSVLGYAQGDHTGPLSADKARFGQHNPHITIEIAPTTWVTTAPYARAYILPHDDPIRQIAPEQLTDPAVWPPSAARRRRLSDIWQGLQQVSAPRPIAGLDVLEAALHEAFTAGKVTVEVDGQPVQDLSSVLLRSEADVGRIDVVRPEKPVPQQTRYLTITMQDFTDSANISKLVSGVVAPLRSQGATIRVRMIFDVQDPGGIDPTIIALNVEETFKQLGIEVQLDRQA